MAMEMAMEMEDLIDSFSIVTTLSSNDEYNLLIKNMYCDEKDYDEKNTIYRYNRYLSGIKFNIDMINLLELYIETPNFRLMKLIDKRIYELLND